MKTIRKKNGLDPQMLGPFKVVGWVTETTVKLESIDGKKLRIHPIVNVNRLRRTNWSGERSDGNMNHGFYQTGDYPAAQNPGIQDQISDDEVSEEDIPQDGAGAADGGAAQPIGSPQDSEDQEADAEPAQEPVRGPGTRATQAERLAMETERYLGTRDVQRHNRTPPTGY